MDIDEAIAERARAGETLTAAELALLDTVDVLSLGMLADEVRRARFGDRVSYCRVLSIDAEPTTDAAIAAGMASADQVRLTVLPASLEDALERVAQARQQVDGALPLVAFSLADVIARGWGVLPDVLGRLAAAGLDALAEAPVDLVSAGDVTTAIAAGLAPTTLSVQRRPDEDRVALLLRVRAIVAASPSMRHFSPLAREQAVTAPTTGYQDVRLVALARLGVPTLERIEVDWQQYGPKLAQVALLFGANHLDRVSPVDDPALGPRRATLEEVRRNIEAAGFRPADPGEAA